MNTSNSEAASRPQAIREAIAEMERLVDEHRRSARKVAMSLAAAFVVLIAAGTVMHLLATYMAIQVMSEFNAAAQAMFQGMNKVLAGSQQSSMNGMSVSSLIDGVRPKVDAIAGYAQGAGVQSYNALLLSGAAVFALVFGVLMSIYKHHLTEISKAQHYKTAFTRMQVALESAEHNERSILVQAALVERAFEYRSGKEKQIESPVPGHPMADASAFLLDKLVETLAVGKRAKSEP